MLEKQKCVRITGYVQSEKLIIWNSVKRELENKNGQKLNDSFVLNYILGQLKQKEINDPGHGLSGEEILTEKVNHFESNLKKRK